MPELNFTQSELVEISDAVNVVITRLLASGDSDQNEKKYGTLTLLRSAQGRSRTGRRPSPAADTNWKGR